MISALPSAAAAVARLTGNASVAAGRLAAQLATPAPWEALAAGVSRAALGSRRWAGARARALQGVAGRAAALLHEELAVVRASAAWRRVDGARRRVLLAGHQLLLLVWKLGATAGAAGGLTLTLTRTRTRTRTRTLTLTLTLTKARPEAAGGCGSGGAAR